MPELTHEEARIFAQAKIAELTRTYRNAGKRMKKELDGATLTAYEKFRASQHISQIKTLARALDVAAKDFADTAIPETYRRGVDLGVTDLAAQNIDAIAQMDSKLHSRAVEILIEQTTADLLTANGTLRQGLIRKIRDTQQRLLSEGEVTGAIIQGVVRGETRRDTSQRLVDELRKRLGDDPKVVAGTRKFDPDYYAELVARTRTREATVKGTENMARSYGVDLVRITVSEDPCPVCQKVQGKVYSLSGEHPDFPLLTDEIRPPLHPKCEHNVSPVIEGTLRRRGEYEHLKRISNDTDAHIYGERDYQRVLAGGDPRREPMDVATRLNRRKSRSSGTTSRPTPREEPPAQKFVRDTAEIERVFRRREERLSRQIERVDAAGRDAPMDEWRRLRQQARALNQQLEAAGEEARKKLRAHLRPETPAIVRASHRSRVTGKRRATWDAGVEGLSQLVDERALAGRSRQVELFAGGRGRSGYAGRGRIKLSTDASAGEVVHELGHWLEDVHPDIHRKAVAFLRERTRGEPLRKLSELTGNPAYEPSERARKDRFLHPYMGKDYGDQGTEIVSMGLEMMYTDPRRLAKEDPEYFDFIYNLARGR